MKKLQKRETRYSINPIRETPVTISSIWCYLWESNQARQMKLSALLYPRFRKRCTFLEPYILAPRFYVPLVVELSRYIDCKKAPSHAKMCQIDGVVLWQIKWNPKDIKSKLSPSYTLSSPLESKRPTLPSVQLSPARISGSDKSSQDFSVGILQEQQKHTFSELCRASATQQGQDWLDFNMTCLLLSVCATSNLELNNILTILADIQAH